MTQEQVEASRARYVFALIPQTGDDVITTPVGR